MSLRLTRLVLSVASSLETNRIRELIEQDMLNITLLLLKNCAFSEKKLDGWEIFFELIN